MTTRRALTGALLGLLAAGAARAAARTQDDAAAQPKVTGTVTYRERIALPPDASVQVRLDDVSQPEASPRRVAETTVAAAGRQVPLAFELSYRATDIVPNRRYVVRARIMAGDKTLFSTKTPYPVITRGAPTKLEIVVEQAGARPGRPRPAATGDGLAGVEWKLVVLASAPVVAPPEGKTARLTLDSAKKSFSGSAGCNEFGGRFEQTGSRLRLFPGAMTRMACPDETMRQEQAFIEALTATTSWRLEDGKLELLAQDARVLARFAASDADAAARSH